MRLTGFRRVVLFWAAVALLPVGCVVSQAPAPPTPTRALQDPVQSSPGAATLSASADIDVVELTVAQIQEDYAAGRYTALQLTQAFLARIAQFEDHYNAFISMNPEAMAAAEVLDEEYRIQGPRGPLHGIPVVVKDNMDYGGLVTTAGYAGFSSATGGVDMIPDDDAAAVERLREAGAIILGKTNMPDFAGDGTRTRSSVAGVTLNPYAVDRAPGGSSGGTATAVNASFAVLGLGTETGGSIQNPAAAQGLVGVKPTFGLVPLEGVVPMSATHVDVVGPLARSVRDAAVAMDVLAGPTEEDHRTFVARGHLPPDGYVAALSDTALRGKRFGLVGEGWRTSHLPLAPDTEALYREAIAALEAQGAEVVEDPFLDAGFVERYRERRGVRSGGVDEMAEYLKGLGEGAPFNSIEEWEALSGQSYRSRGRRGSDTAEGDSIRRAARREWEERREREERRQRQGAEEVRTFLDWRKEIQAFFSDVLAEHRLDGLFFPQAGAPIRPLVEDPERPEYSPNNHPELPSNIVNDMGIPVVTLPFAYYDDGTPFVLAFIGEAWTEAELLAFAYDLEQATRGRRPPQLRERSGG
jgi:Asp-tRNA(Asn)/Glu-tRNA(Gln) amidotransferase A subunit family amidase